MPYKMPFNVTFRSPDGETFIETVCADSTYEARSICHSMYDATIVHVEHATVHPHCVIETEVPNGIQSIIYSSVNKWAAEDQCVKLNAAFPSGTRYTYRTETLDI